MASPETPCLDKIIKKVVTKWLSLDAQKIKTDDNTRCISLLWCMQIEINFSASELL